MSKESLTPFEAAKREFGDQSSLCILGFSGSGKTVVSSLLFETIVNKFVPDHSDNYEFRVKSGIEYLKQISLALKSGHFPSSTKESDINHVEMVLTQQPSGGEISIKFNDVSGELQGDLLSKELSSDGLINKILTHEKIKTAPFGPFSFLPFCKAYVLLIDCEEIKEWPTRTFDYMQLLNNLLALKKATGEADHEKITNPVAIMFTKLDLLNEEDRLKSPQDLLQAYMPAFASHFKSLTKDSSFFKVFLDVERGTDNIPIKIAFEQNKDKMENQSKPDAIKDTVVEQITYKVKIPLSYDEDEYVNFISWIDEKLR